MADAVAKIIVQSDTDQAVDGAQKVESAYENAANSVHENFTKAGAALTAFAAAGTAAIIGLAKGAMEGETAMAQLNHAIIDVSGGTAETVTAFEDLATQLQANGVLNKDAIVTGMAQLSTFGLSTDAVYGLSSSMADLAVNQFGINASQDQLTQTANMMQKALQGQFGVLEKSGIRFTEAQQEMILYGTEMEKVAAINEGFAQNLKFTNEVAMQTFAGQLENLKNKFGEAIGPLEDAMIPALQKLAEVVSVAVDWIAGLDPKVLQIAGVALLAATAFAAVAGPILLLIGLLPTLVAGFTVLASVISAVWLAITGPIGLVIVAIGLLVAAGVAIMRHWDEIKAYAITVWTSIKDFFVSIWEGIKDAFNSAVESVKSTVQGAFDTMKMIFDTFWQYVGPLFEVQLAALEFLLTGDFTRMQEFVVGIWDSIKLMFETVWNAIKTTFTTVLGTINTFFRTTWEGIKNFFAGLWDQMTALVETGLNLIIELVGIFTDPIKEAFQALWDGVAGVISAGVEIVKSTIKASLNFIIEMINKAIRGINVLAAAGAKISGVSIPSLPEIPMLAEGGIVTSPTLAMIGEGGQPEAVIPLDKLGSMGGGNTYNFYGPVSSREVAMEYADMITREFGMSNKMV